MSLITRCPACGTYFKVVADQLRVSEGWVRCGQCDEVFDGNAHLQGAPTVAPPVPPSDGVLQTGAGPLDRGGVAEAPPSARTPEVSAPPGWQPPPDRVEPAPEPEADEAPALAPVTHANLAAAAATEPVWEAWSGSDVAPDAPLPSTSATEVPRDDDVQAEHVAWESVPSSEATAPPRGFAIPPMPVMDVEAVPRAKASFLSDPSSAGQRRRWPAVLLAGLLTLLLASQAVWHWRDAVGAHAPALAPVLDEVCVWMGCRLQALRQIDQVVIESSGFVKVRSDVYRLSFSVRNNASVALAMPALELSLTDPREQSLVRRVLTPGEYGAPGPALAPGQEWAGVVALSLKQGALGSEKVSGYRLLVFYP